MSAPQPAPYPSRYASAIERTRALAKRVVWTALPCGSLGLLAWVQALRVARRRRTAKAWWWLAGLAGSTAVECVLLAVVPSHPKDESGTAAGSFVVAHIVTASVYNWRNSKNTRRTVVLRDPYPVAPTAWLPAPFEYPPMTPMTPVAPVAPVTSVAPMTPVTQAPDMAAEVQAELRELRGLLGNGDAQ